MTHTFGIEEGDRQAIILALAKLSHTRPGWHAGCLLPLARKLGGESMYEQFRSHGPDPTPGQFLEEPYTFNWKADGQVHELTIMAQNYAAACYKLALHHAAAFGKKAPQDFEIDLTEPKKEGEGS